MTAPERRGPTCGALLVDERRVGSVDSSDLEPVMAQDLRHHIRIRLMMTDNQDGLVHDASLSGHPSHGNGRTRCSRRSLCKRLPDPFQHSPLPDRAAVPPYRTIREPRRAAA
jgi:hypothetical protein